MKRIKVILVASLIASSSGIGSSGAQECCPNISCPAPVEVACAPAPVTEQYVLQEHTVMVPRHATQKQRVASTVYQTIQRPKVETVYEQVPEYVPVNTQQTVMVPQTVLQPQTVTTMQAYYRDVPYQYQAQSVETQQVERVFEETRNVPRDVTYRIKTQRVRKIDIPGQPTRYEQLGEPTYRCETKREYRTESVPVSKLATVDVPKMSLQTATQRVLEYQPVQQTYQVPVTVNVPQVQTTTQHVLQYRTVPRQVTTMESVQVPVAVEHEVDVPTIEYVPMRVQSYVPLSSLRNR